jgi:hypothetical protein
LSKRKQTKLLVISIAFFILGFWVLIFQPEVSNIIFNNSIVKYGAGAVSVLMGLLGIYFFARKLKDKRPGLIISGKSIIDNASGISAGEILWEDIIEIKIFKVFQQKLIMLILKHPEEYISRQKNSLKRKMMSANYKSYGSPVSITANSIDIEFSELKLLFEQKLAEHKSKKPI